MRQILISAGLAFMLAVPALGQDSIFESRRALRDFIWDKVSTRDFIPLIQRLGGRDEYTKEQLAGVNTQFLSIYARDFTDVAQVEERVLENGFRKEVVAFWNGLSYAWLYLLTHETDGKVVVITFRLNSEVGPVMEPM